MLWQSLEEWLNLLRKETEQILQNSDFASLSKDSFYTCNSPRKDDAEPEKKGKKDHKDRLSLSREDGTEDEHMVAVVAPRICGVIQAFYTCCSTVVQNE